MIRIEFDNPRDMVNFFCDEYFIRLCEKLREMEIDIYD